MPWQTMYRVTALDPFQGGALLGRAPTHVASEHGVSVRRSHPAPRIGFLRATPLPVIEDANRRRR